MIHLSDVLRHKYPLRRRGIKLKYKINFIISELDIYANAVIKLKGIWSYYAREIPEHADF